MSCYCAFYSTQQNTCVTPAIPLLAVVKNDDHTDGMWNIYTYCPLKYCSHICMWLGVISHHGTVPQHWQTHWPQSFLHFFEVVNSFWLQYIFWLTRCLYSNVKCNFTKYAIMFRDKATCAVYFLFVKWWVEPWFIFHPHWYMLCQPLQNVVHWNKHRGWNSHHIPLKCFTEANCLVCVMRVWL